MSASAPYPAAATAAVIASAEVWEGSKSAVMELESRFTWTFSTPATWLTAFSTLAAQAAQVIPVT